jgi:GTPase SAR1 family protein
MQSLTFHAGCNPNVLCLAEQQQGGAKTVVRYKVVLEGTYKCGKTCLWKSMKGQPFDPEYVSMGSGCFDDVGGECDRDDDNDDDGGEDDDDDDVDDDGVHPPLTVLVDQVPTIGVDFCHLDVEAEGQGAMQLQVKTAKGFSPPLWE